MRIPTGDFTVVEEVAMYEELEEDMHERSDVAGVIRERYKNIARIANAVQCHN